MDTKKKPEIPLPKGWRRHIRSAVLPIIPLAQYATVTVDGIAHSEICCYSSIPLFDSYCVRNKSWPGFLWLF